MQDPVSRAHAILDHAEATLAAAGPAVWWTEVRALLWHIERTPLLGEVVEGIDWRAARWFEHPSNAPEDPVERGRQAFVALALHHQGRPEMRTLLSTATGGGPYERRSWEQDLRGQLNVYTSALIRLLRQALSEQASLNFFVERWTRRVELFPPPITKEADLQLDLYRYLFDAGVEPADAGREFATTNGRVDFLLRGDVPAAVELKLWRDASSLADLRHWIHQASQYPRDLAGMKHGYLVIANLSANRLHVPRSMDAGEIHLQLRVADLSRRASSRDGARPVRTLLASDLWP